MFCGGVVWRTVPYRNWLAALVLVRCALSRRRAGVSCAEVEIDTLTGDHTVLRVDVVMDIGNSINPTLDVGQIEGALAQGVGLCTLEEVVWGDSAHPWVKPGQLHTRGPGACTPSVPALSVLFLLSSPSDFTLSLHSRCCRCHSGTSPLHFSRDSACSTPRSSLIASLAWVSVVP
jgi:hypothetical protein